MIKKIKEFFELFSWIHKNKKEFVFDFILEKTDHIINIAKTLHVNAEPTIVKYEDYSILEFLDSMTERIVHFHLFDNNLIKFKAVDVVDGSKFDGVVDNDIQIAHLLDWMNLMKPDFPSKYFSDIM